MTYVRIDSNTANGSGGGLFSSVGEYIATASTLIGIRRNISSSSGGGIYSVSGNGEYDTFALFDMRKVQNNVTMANGGGIMVQDYQYLYAVNTSITDNVAGMSDNNAYGGGIYHNNYNHELINSDFINCTIANNHVESQSGNGGGFYNSNNATSLTNSIVWHNEASQTSNIHQVYQISYSNIEDGNSDNGNIDSDPLFVDMNAGDYRYLITVHLLVQGL